MPNIEIIGYRPKRTRKLAESIWSIFMGSLHSTDPLHKMGDDVVITEHPNIRVTNKRGQHMPFLRISGTKKKEVKLIMAALEKKPEAFDIEVIIIDRFIQTKGSRNLGRRFGVPATELQQ